MTIEALELAGVLVWTVIVLTISFFYIRSTRRFDGPNKLLVCGTGNIQLELPSSLVALSIVDHRETFGLATIIQITELRLLQVLCLENCNLGLSELRSLSLFYTVDSPVYLRHVSFRGLRSSIAANYIHMLVKECPHIESLTINVTIPLPLSHFLRISRVHDDDSVHKADAEILSHLLPSLLISVSIDSLIPITFSAGQLLLKSLSHIPTLSHLSIGDCDYDALFRFLVLTPSVYEVELLNEVPYRIRKQLLLNQTYPCSIVEDTGLKRLGEVTVSRTGIFVPNPVSIISKTWDTVFSAGTRGTHIELSSVCLISSNANSELSLVLGSGSRIRSIALTGCTDSPRALMGLMNLDIESKVLRNALKTIVSEDLVLKSVFMALYP